MTTTTKSASTYETGNLYQVPPGALLLERNIRDAQPDPELLASVAALGVLQPITAAIAADGHLVVRLGHRRTLAALKAERPTVPVYVTDVDDTADAAEVSRIISQRDENTLRAGLTAGDELGVVEQLAAFGMSADEISKQARIGKDRVTTALTVSRSKLAAKATAKFSDITLDQAASVAEFDDDPETAKALILAAVQEPDTFEHVAQRARDDRSREAHRARLLAGLADAGVPVVERPNYDAKVKALHRLRNDKDKEVTEAAHRKCPGHVAWLHTEWQWVDSDGNLTATRADGSRQIQLPLVAYGCKDPKKHGHVDSWSASSAASRPSAADMSPEERAKAKKERALVIENNKAWDAAQAVRRAWVAELATRKTAPAGTASFIAAALSEDRYILTHDGSGSDRAKLCAEFGLTMVKHGYSERVSIPQGTTEARALVIALVQILAAHEAALDRGDWRRNGKTERHGRYLAFLKSAGYGLSEVEKFALSSRSVG